MDDHRRVGDPPSYEAYDWIMAESFWETRETWPFFRKLREALRIDRAFIKSRHWLTSPQDLQYRKYIFFKALIAVKAFRRQVKRGEVTPDAVIQRKTAVYRSYAQAMNEVEIWTDYRFPRTARLPNFNIGTCDKEDPSLWFKHAA